MRVSGSDRWRHSLKGYAPQIEQGACELLALGSQDACGDGADTVKDLEESDEGSTLR